MKTQQSFSINNETGTLYLVPTPIGNLSDITYRAVETLKEADLILAEDTRQTMKLCQHYGVLTPLESYHAHTNDTKREKIIDQLESGANFALVSDAGTPLINDPGARLVSQAVERDITVISLPGPNAAITALVASGLATEKFTYYGFFPRSNKERREQLELVGQRKETAIFYESPYRVASAVESIMKELTPETKIVIARELTKRYEEYIRGTAEEVASYLEDNPIKGECVILVEGGTKPKEDKPNSDLPLKDQVNLLIKEKGLKPNAAIKQVAHDNNLVRKVVYNAYHELD